MNRLHINPGLHADLNEACVELGGHGLQRILQRIRDEEVALSDEDVDVIREFIQAIEAHLDRKYPNHLPEERGYQPEQEDLYLDASARYRDKLVYQMADALGDGFVV